MASAILSVGNGIAVGEVVTSSVVSFLTVAPLNTVLAMVAYGARFWSQVLLPLSVDIPSLLLIVAVLSSQVLFQLLAQLMLAVQVTIILGVLLQLIATPFTLLTNELYLPLLSSTAILFSSPAPLLVLTRLAQARVSLAPVPHVAVCVPCSATVASSYTHATVELPLGVGVLNPRVCQLPPE